MHAAVKKGWSSFKMTAAAVGLAVCLLLAGTAAAQTGTPNISWYSTAGTAFNLSTADQLAGLARIVNGATVHPRDNFAGKSITITADINLSAYTNWTPIGDASSNGANVFHGNFDGGGKVISGLAINRTANSWQGLFGIVKNGEIKNVKLQGVNVIGGGFVGALAGQLQGNAKVVNCYSAGTVSGSGTLGGLVGAYVADDDYRNGGVYNSYSTCAVSGTATHIGGVAGLVRERTVVNSYSTGAVSGTSEVGGVIGVCYNCFMKDNAALNPEVKGTGENVGRVVGRLGGTGVSENGGGFTGLKNSAGNVTWTGTAANNGADITNMTITYDGTIGNRFTVANGWTVYGGKMPGLGAYWDLPAHLSVPDPQQPTFSSLLSNATYALNAAATPLSVTASVTDGGTLSYRWYRSSNPYQFDYSGEPLGTASTYTPPTSELGTYFYMAEAINTKDYRTSGSMSNMAQITVRRAAVQTPEIISHPQNATYTQGGAAVQMYVVAKVTDGGTLSYQWFRNTTPTTTGGTAVGTDSDRYTPVTTAAGTLYYYVRVRNTADAIDPAPKDVMSNVAAVTINTLTNAQKPAISAQPVGGTYILSATASPMTVTASVTDAGSLSYQWYSNTSQSNSGGAVISGAISASYTPLTTTAGTYYYYVIVQNTNANANGNKTETVTSQVATVRVMSAGNQSNLQWYTADPTKTAFTISNAADLAGLAGLVNGDFGEKISFSGKTITLGANISLSGYANWTPIGDFASGSWFQATFDGNGKVISNLAINRPGADYQGLFGVITGSVKNLGLENVNVRGRDKVGGLVGELSSNGAIVTNCYSTGAVSGNERVGGLAGFVNSSAKLHNSYSSCVVSGVQQVGGVAGAVQEPDGNFPSELSNCYSTGSVSGTQFVGGVVGAGGGRAGSTIKDCAALNSNVRLIVGEFVGRVVGSIDRTTVSGLVAYNGIRNNAGSLEWANKGADKQDGTDLTAEAIRGNGNIGGLFTAANGWTVEDGKLPGLFGNAVELPEHLRGLTTAVQESSREIQTSTITDAAAIVPFKALTAEFTAGPNPAAKSAGVVAFYRQGGRVDSGALTIYDAAGNVVRKIAIRDKAAGSLRATPETPRRQVGFWDLKDSKGRNVADGTYLVKGVLKSPGGKAEKVSLLLGVRQ